MTTPTCPMCSSEYVIRVRRQGFFERSLSVIYIYPFRCQLCSHRFSAWQPGVRYKRIDEDKREYQRMPVDFTVVILSKAVRSESKALDISMGGCTLEPATELIEKDIVRLELKIQADQPTIAVETALIRTVQPKRVGVEFLRFQPAERRRLQGYIRSRLSVRPN